MKKRLQKSFTDELDLKGSRKEIDLEDYEEQRLANRKKKRFSEEGILVMGSRLEKFKK